MRFLLTLVQATAFEHPRNAGLYLDSAGTFKSADGAGQSA